MSENLSILWFTDRNGVRVHNDRSSNILCSHLLFKNAYSDPTAAFLSVCEYIEATAGITETTDSAERPLRETTLTKGKFRVDKQTFIDEFSRFYGLTHYGKEWQTQGEPIRAGMVKQYIQFALLPFDIEQKILFDIYNLLLVRCSTADVEAASLKCVTAQEINENDYERPPYIVEGFLYPGLTILAAPPKTGKSFLSLDLGCCVAAGLPFWNFPTNGGDVLYLDLEGKEWRTKSRLPGLGYKRLPEGITHAYSCNRIDDGLISQLERWIDSVKTPKLIIIDTIAHVKGRVARGEDAYSADTRFMKPLHDLAIKRGIAILAITHTRKSNGLLMDDPFDAVIGSTAQYGNSDAGWIISGKRNEAKKTFVATGRDFESVSFEIEFVNGKWVFMGTTEAAQEASHGEEYKSNKAAKVIRERVIAAGGIWSVTAQEFITAAAQDTGEYLAADATRASKMLRQLAPDLLKYDGIVTKFPESGGRSSRRITFAQRNMLD